MSRSLKSIGSASLSLILTAASTLIASAAPTLILSAVIAPMWACTPKDQAVRLRIEAKTNQGEPVSGAVVSLDGKPIGETDLTGQFLSDKTLPVGSKPRIEVRKDSDQYYFAPFNETFTVAEAAASESGDVAAPAEVALKAVLYFVPKPKPGDETADVAVQVVAETAPTEPAPPVVDAAAEPAADPIVETVTEPGQDDLVTVATADPVVENAPSVKAETVEERGAPEQVGEEPKVEAPVVLAPAFAENDVEIDAAATKPIAVEKSDLKTLTPTVLTVHVTSGEAPLAEVEVTVGEEDAAGLKPGCTTNERGRCVIRFAEAPSGNIMLVASKLGFKTGTLLAPVPKAQGLLKLNLEHGHTLDIYAVTKAYNYTVGLKSAEVVIDGKRVGETDRYGRYSHVYEGKSEALMTIGLKPKGYLPETYETDFVASGPMKLIKYFTPAQPPAVRMTVVETRVAGKMDQTTASGLNKQMDDAVHASARKHVFASSAFKEFPMSLYERAAKKSGKTLGDLLRGGWVDTELKSVVDALLIPTAIIGPKPALELSIVDSQGRILAAAREDMETLTDTASIDRAVAVLAKKLTRAFPFEGAVISKEADKVTINVGYSHGRGIKAGDVLDVYGVQLEKLGMSQLHRRIATLTVREVFDAETRCSVSKLAPRATIERGDMVVLRPRKAPDSGGTEIKVVDAADGKTTVLSQANVYFNDQWVGATDDSGRLYLDASGSGTIKVVKQGFAEYAKPATLAAGVRISLPMKREVAFLRIDSKPNNLVVKVEGKIIGKTPLAAGVAVPSGFVKLELEAPSGFKPYSSILELDQGTLDLSGVRSIALEQDFRAQAQRLQKQGKIDEALTVLESIPKEHSDYLLARHEAGEIYLTIKDEPAKAAEAFGMVTANEAVKQFTDKRFIGSHINEGIALYMTAEKLAAAQPDEARAHYQKAIEVLEGVVPYLRFVPADQYAQSVHNVDYHRALARHRLWLLSHDPRVLADAVRTWRAYLDGSARSVPADGASKAYVDNAQVYFRQATASLNSSRGVSKQ